MFSTHVSSFCLTRHIDITGVFRILLHTGVHGTNGPMVNTLVIDIQFFTNQFFDDDDDSHACLEV